MHAQRCACKCYHDVQWTCGEGESVVCKAKFGAQELKTVGDKVCRTPTKCKGPSWLCRPATSDVRSRLYQRRFLQPNSHFSAFFKIYKIFRILRRSNLKILQNFVKIFGIFKKNLQNFKKKSNFFEKFENFEKFLKITKILTNFCKILRFERRRIVKIL